MNISDTTYNKYEKYITIVMTIQQVQLFILFFSQGLTLAY